MKKSPFLLGLGLAMLAPNAQANNNPTAKSVTTIAYSSDSHVFYFYLDGYTVPSRLHS